MNPLLSSHEESVKTFDETFIKISDQAGFLTEWISLDDEGVQSLKSHLTSSKIKEWEAVIEMLEGRKQPFCQDDNEKQDFGRIQYNSALSHIQDLYREAINQIT